MYAKMKELGPVGGRAPGTPPRSANAWRLDLISDNKVTMQSKDRKDELNLP